MDLTDTQRDILDAMPATLNAIADDLGMTKSGVEYHVHERLRPMGYRFDVDEGYVWSVRDTPPSSSSATDTDEDEDETDTDEDEDETDTDEDDEDAEDAADAEDDDEDTPDVPNLDSRQATVIRTLPATLDDIDAVIDEVSAHTALDELRDDGVLVRYDDASEKFYLADERSKQLRSQTHLSLSAKTKRAKAALREEQALLERLPDTTPLSIDDFDPDPNRETMVAAISDLHFGDIVKDDRGRLTYDRDIVFESTETFARKVIKHKRQWGAEYDELVIPILGDIATGTEIYQTQKTEIESLLARQIKDGSQALTTLVATLREHFDAVRVYCVVGNHGFQSASAARGSNTDLTCYFWMRDALRREGYDDVEVTIGEHSHHLNFEIRDWRVHIRHGQDSQQQVDETARSEADWRGWRDKHKFDLAIRGHHHVPSLHWVLNRYPVVSLPSPKPGGEFADRIGSPDASAPADHTMERKLGYCFGVSNDRRITDSRMTDAG
jgi:predicted phosphodiesterase